MGLQIDVGVCKIWIAYYSNSMHAMRLIALKAGANVQKCS